MAKVGDAPGRALVLIGFMGVGKSTVARQLAQALGVAAIDSDELLEERFGHPVAQEFELHGEDAFRSQEEQLVCELLAGAAGGSVIALGGGSVLSQRVRDALEPHLVVLLELAPELAWDRIVSGANGSLGTAGRPLAGDRDEFLALHGERRALYERLADAFLPGIAIDAMPQTVRALRALAAAPHGTRLIWARSASGEYPVLIGRGLLRALGAPHGEDVWPLDRSLSRPFCVTDETVGSLYAERLGPMHGTIAIAPGEAHKTIASAESVWHALIAAQVDRGDHLVALGGGVVGDLAGFCAATYQRGIPVVHIPTTLLAQVDSAYGGKTGVDLPEAKNYVGAYHQPAGVLVDPDALASLSSAELAAGWVEVLKTALIAGGSLWERVLDDEDLDQDVLLACARTKLSVVAADERDGGRRQVLNLGHTVGHAIEAATGYTRYRHGEAVGLGLLAALRLSGAAELRAQVREMLLERDLPVALEGVSVERVLAGTGHDKKRVAAKLPFVLVRAPGQARTGCEVDAADLRAAVTELAQG